jgi:hypothetical protein
MQTSLYQINKGINKPVEFRGFKAQYIWYLGAGLLGLLIIFAILYICGVNSFICLGLVLVLGAAMFSYVYKLSHTYGQYGMQKKMAKRSIPTTVKSYSRKEFTELKK